MKDPTRREFLWTSGLGLLAAGCAPTGGGLRSEERTPRRRDRRRLGRREPPPRYVRLADPSTRSSCSSRTSSSSRARFSNLVSAVRHDRQHNLRYDRCAPTASGCCTTRRRRSRPNAKAGPRGQRLPPLRAAHRSPGVEFQWEQVEGLARPRTGAARVKGGAADRRAGSPAQAMRTRGVFVYDSAGRLSVPALPSSARVRSPGISEQQAEVEAHRAPTPTRTSSRRRALPRAWAELSEHRVPRLHKVVKVDPGTRRGDDRARDKVKYDGPQPHPAAARGDDCRVGRTWSAPTSVVRGQPPDVRVREHKNIHVIGDSTIGLAGAKSGTSPTRWENLRARGGQPPQRQRVPPMAPGQHLLQLGERPGGHRGRQRVQIEGGKYVQIEQKLTPRPVEMWAQNAVGWATASGRHARLASTHGKGQRDADRSHQPLLSRSPARPRRDRSTAGAPPPR